MANAPEPSGPYLTAAILCESVLQEKDNRKSVVRILDQIDNPKHRRSKLVQLTRKGDARYHELNARFLVIASTMGVALSEADIRKTTEIVRQLSDDVKARSERLS